MNSFFNRTMFYNTNTAFVEHLKNIQLFTGYAPMPLNIVRSNTLSFIWNILQIFFKQNFSKIFYKTHQIASFFKKISWGSMPPTPSNRVASPPVAWREEDDTKFLKSSLLLMNLMTVMPFNLT